MVTEYLPSSEAAPTYNSLLPLECVSLDIECHHLRVTDLDTLWVVARIELASHRQTGPGRGGGNQLDHRFTAGQRLAGDGMSLSADRPRRVLGRSEA